MALSVQNPTLNPKGVEPLRVKKSALDPILQGMNIIQTLGSVAGAVDSYQTLRNANMKAPAVHKDLVAPQPYYNPKMNTMRGTDQRLAFNSPLYTGIFGA